MLAGGKAFHHKVQQAYVAGLLGVELHAATERIIVRPGGARQRADILLVVITEPERMQFVVEIKSTEWIGRPPDNRRQLFKRHLRQLDGYLDILIDDMGIGVDSVTAALLYPHRPDQETVGQLEAIALPRGIMVVFYDGMDWRLHLSLSYRPDR